MEDKKYKSEYASISEFYEAKSAKSVLDKHSTCFLPLRYRDYARELANFEVRKDDVWSITFPKSGSTWSQEMIWQLNNNCDFELASQSKIHERFVFLEFDVLFNCAELHLNQIEILKSAKSPRHIKSHLPLGLLPNQLWTVKPKIVYVSRRCKDAVVSYYHHMKNMHGYEASFADFSTAFMANKMLYSPYIDHVLDFWAIRNEDHVLFITYEQMKTDLRSVLQRTAKFLEKSYTNERLKKLTEHLSIKSMRANPSVNFQELVAEMQNTLNLQNVDGNFKFLRNGQVDAYKTEMTADLISKFDHWCELSIEKYNELHANGHATPINLIK